MLGACCLRPSRHRHTAFGSGDVMATVWRDDVTVCAPTGHGPAARRRLVLGRGGRTAVRVTGMPIRTFGGLPVWHGKLKYTILLYYYYNIILAPIGCGHYILVAPEVERLGE